MLFLLVCLFYRSEMLFFLVGKKQLISYEFSSPNPFITCWHWRFCCSELKETEIAAWRGIYIKKIVGGSINNAVSLVSPHSLFELLKNLLEILNEFLMVCLRACPVHAFLRVKLLDLQVNMQRWTVNLPSILYCMGCQGLVSSCVSSHLPQVFCLLHHWK